MYLLHMSRQEIFIYGFNNIIYIATQLKKENHFNEKQVIVRAFKSDWSKRRVLK